MQNICRMAYKISNKANQDIDSIWIYTLKLAQKHRIVDIMN
jgi:plasmid stabilization system protein ParE